MSSPPVARQMDPLDNKQSAQAEARAASASAGFIHSPSRPSVSRHQQLAERIKTILGFDIIPAVASREATPDRFWRSNKPLATLVLFLEPAPQQTWTILYILLSDYPVPADSTLQPPVSVRSLVCSARHSKFIGCCWTKHLNMSKNRSTDTKTAFITHPRAFMLRVKRGQSPHNLFKCSIINNNKKSLIQWETPKNMY